MTALSDPATAFIVVVLIGIAAGLLIERVVRTSWLSRQVAGARRLAVTNALVGIAGAFIGYNLAMLLLHAGRDSLVPFLGAIIGAAVVLWAWRAVKL